MEAKSESESAAKMREVLSHHLTHTQPAQHVHTQHVHTHHVHTSFSCLAGDTFIRDVAIVTSVICSLIIFRAKEVWIAHSWSSPTPGSSRSTKVCPAFHLSRPAIP